MFRCRYTCTAIFRQEDSTDATERRGLTLNALLCKKGGDGIAITRWQKYYPALKSLTIVLYNRLDDANHGTIEQDMKFLSRYCIVAKAMKVVVQLENMSKTRLVIAEDAKRRKDR